MQSADASVLWAVLFIAILFAPILYHLLSSLLKGPPSHRISIGVDIAGAQATKLTAVGKVGTAQSRTSAISPVKVSNEASPQVPLIEETTEDYEAELERLRKQTPQQRAYEAFSLYFYCLLPQFSQLPDTRHDHLYFALSYHKYFQLWNLSSSRIRPNRPAAALETIKIALALHLLTRICLQLLLFNFLYYYGFEAGTTIAILCSDPPFCFEPAILTAGLAMVLAGLLERPLEIAIAILSSLSFPIPTQWQRDRCMRLYSPNVSAARELMLAHTPVYLDSTARWNDALKEQTAKAQQDLRLLFDLQEACRTVRSRGPPPPSDELLLALQRQMVFLRNNHDLRQRYCAAWAIDPDTKAFIVDAKPATKPTGTTATPASGKASNLAVLSSMMVHQLIDRELWTIKHDYQQKFASLSIRLHQKDMAESTSAHLGIDLFHLFMRDLLGRDTSQANLLEALRDLPSGSPYLVRYDLEWLLLTWLAIILVIVSSITLFIKINQANVSNDDHSNDISYAGVFVATLLVMVDMLFSETLECLWMHYWCPRTIHKDIINMKDQVLNSFRETIEVKLCAEPIHCNAAEQLFVSHKLAMNWPEILESSIILNFKSLLPGVYSRRWKPQVNSDGGMIAKLSFHAKLLLLRVVVKPLLGTLVAQLWVLAIASLYIAIAIAAILVVFPLLIVLDIRFGWFMRCIAFIKTILPQQKPSQPPAVTMGGSEPVPEPEPNMKTEVSANELRPAEAEEPVTSQVISTQPQSFKATRKVIESKENDEDYFTFEDLAELKKTVPQFLLESNAIKRRQKIVEALLKETEPKSVDSSSGSREDTGSSWTFDSRPWSGTYSSYVSIRTFTDYGFDEYETSSSDAYEKDDRSMGSLSDSSDGSEESGTRRYPQRY